MLSLQSQEHKIMTRFDKISIKIKAHLLNLTQALTAYQRNYVMLMIITGFEEQPNTRFDLFLKSGKKERAMDQAYKTSKIGEEMFYEDFAFNYYLKILTQLQLSKKINIFSMKEYDERELQQIRGAEREYRALQIYEQI